MVDAGVEVLMGVGMCEVWGVMPLALAAEMGLWVCIGTLDIV